MFIPKRRCKDNHAIEIINLDLSRAYKNDKYKSMWQIRCAVKPNTCEFSEYYYHLQDAISGWEKGELL